MKSDQQNKIEGLIGLIGWLIIIFALIGLFIFAFRSCGPGSTERKVDEGCRKAGGVPVYELHEKYITITCHLERANEG